MALLSCGISYRRAPVSVRERFAVSDAGRRALLESLLRLPGVTGAAALATCNRTEVYLSTGASARAREALADLLASHAGLAVEDCRPLLVWRRGLGAVRHLLGVAAGLDSLVVGENQVLAQVKAAREAAREAGSLDPALDRLFLKAVQSGRRARTETDISRGVASVSHAAVEMARQRLGRLDTMKVLVLGAGKMGSLAMRHLASAGVAEIRVSNRSLERACEVSRRFGARAIPLDDLAAHLREVDLVLCATGAPHTILARPQVEEAMARRQGRPLVLVDLALPRDVDPDCGTVPGVHVLDLDDLHGAVQRARALRSRSAARVREILEEEVDSWRVAEADRRASEAIRDLRAALAKALEPSLDRLRATPGLAPAGADLDLASHRILQKVLHGPTVVLRQAAREGLHRGGLRRLARTLAARPAHRRSLPDLLALA